MQTSTINGPRAWQRRAPARQGVWDASCAGRGQMLPWSCQEQRQVAVSAVFVEPMRGSYSEDEEELGVMVKRIKKGKINTIPIITPSASIISTPASISSTSTDDERAPISASPTNPTPNLFEDTHVQNWTLPLIAYAPVGTVLATFRMTCWVLGILIDAPWFRNPAVVQTYCNLLGFKTIWRDLHLLPEGHHVMVSNHTTSADLMALFSLPQRYTHLITTAMPARVTATNHLPVVLRPASPAMYEELARQHAAAGPFPSLPPVHVFPEGGLTNGNGMLQFSRGFSKFVTPTTLVVPVALRARTPWGIRTHTLNSSFLANLFWLSFCPWVELEAIVLPPTTQAEGEGRGAFVQRVQNSIARELRVPVSEMTIQHKRQIMKQRADKRR